VLQGTLFQHTVPELTHTGVIKFNHTVRCTGLMDASGVYSVLTSIPKSRGKRTIIVVNLQTLKVERTFSSYGDPAFVDSQHVYSIDANEKGNVISRFSFKDGLEENLLLKSSLKFIVTYLDAKTNTQFALFHMNKSGKTSLVSISLKEFKEVKELTSDRKYVSETANCESVGQEIFCKAESSLGKFVITDTNITRTEFMALPKLYNDVHFQLDPFVPNTIHWVSLTYADALKRYMKIITTSLTWTGENELKESDTSPEEFKFQLAISSANNIIVYSHVEYPALPNLTVYDTLSGKSHTVSLREHRR
jgi:hypothetical protein